jgi:hypothetical protein
VIVPVIISPGAITSLAAGGHLVGTAPRRAKFFTCFFRCVPPNIV